MKNLVFLSLFMPTVLFAHQKSKNTASVIDYRAKIELIEKHVIDGMFTLTFKEFKKCRDTLENTSNRIIILSSKLESIHDSLVDEKILINKELVDMRRVFFDIICQRVLKMSFKDITSISVKNNEIDKNQLELSLVACYYFPIEGRGLHFLPIKNKPKFTLFF